MVHIYRSVGAFVQEHVILSSCIQKVVGVGGGSGQKGQEKRDWGEMVRIYRSVGALVQGH